MNIFDEIRNRWHRVFEQKTDELKHTQIQTIAPLTIAADIKVLQERVRELEAKLTDAMNPVSSSFGPVTLLKDGTLHYMINGSYVELPSIHKALEFLADKLKNDEAFTKKFVAQYGNEVADEIKAIFRGPV